LQGTEGVNTVGAPNGSLDDALDHKGSARLLDVLDAFIELNRETVALRDIAEHLQLPKSTVHRLLAILRNARYVDQEEQTDRYRLGNRAFRLGAVAIQNNSLARVAHPFLQALVEKTGESVHLASLDGDRALVLDRVESNLQIIRAVSLVGSRSPLHSTGVGKAILAWLPDAEREQLLARLDLRRITPNTITDRDVLEQELAKARGVGYVVDDGESLTDVRCIAVPIRNVRQRLVGSLSITAPMHRLPRERIPEFASLARAIAEEISVRYGAG
jgi:DNA-binding IclR family transcriptional regulator